MKLAIHNWMRTESLEHSLNRLPPLGYTHFEIMGEPVMYADTTKIKGMLDERGLKCWGSVTLMLDRRNLLAADEADRAMSVQYVKDIVKMVAELGGTMVSVVPATVGKLVADARPELEWEWAVASMKEIYAYSEAQGILLGIEPINRFETYFINRGAQAMALAEATGPNCGVCLDAFHMNIEEEDMFATIRAVGDRLVGFHVADNNRMAPGMGKLDWPKIVATLQEVGYQGPLSVEFSAPIDRTPANPYPNSVDENPTDLSPEMAKFIADHGSSIPSDEFYSMLVAKSAETLLPLIS